MNLFNLPEGDAKDAQNDQVWNKQIFGLSLQYVPSYSVYKRQLTMSIIPLSSITYEMPKKTETTSSEL